MSSILQKTFARCSGLAQARQTAAAASAAGLQQQPSRTYFSPKQRNRARVRRAAMMKERAETEAETGEAYMSPHGPALPRPKTDHTTTRRIKLPNATFKMMKPGKEVPKNVVVFRVPLDYNKKQIENYLTEIYQVEVLKVNTLIQLGKMRSNEFGMHYKRPDFKKAYVAIKGEFRYPDISM